MYLTEMCGLDSSGSGYRQVIGCCGEGNEHSALHKMLWVSAEHVLPSEWAVVYLRLHSVVWSDDIELDSYVKGTIVAWSKYYRRIRLEGKIIHGLN
jgi:hypothetical protein